MLLAPCWINAM